jgi:hypothetical protein
VQTTASTRTASVACPDGQLAGASISPAGT